MMQAAEQAARREMGADEYAEIVDVRNFNREDDVIVASGIDAAVSAMAELGLSPAAVAGPLTFKEFFDRELPRLKEDKPNLKLPQYKDIAFKLWQRAPENPANQAR